jgi:hypothetical protein
MSKQENTNKLGFWKRLFMVLGIIFSVILVIVIVIIIFVAIKKPFGLDVTQLPSAVLGTGEVTASSYDHPVLSEEQEVFLENLGIDTETVPTTITAEQEACAVGKLGQKRVDEIKAGAALNSADYLKAGRCFQ